MRRALLLGFVGALSSACGGGSGDEPPPTTSGVASTCASGQIAGYDGACMPVGIQGCAPQFLEADGLCHPALDKCPAGTIPDFATGCVPVGIQGCAAKFVKDGLCQPAADACTAGTYPVPLDGCVPIDGAEGCGTGTWGNIADAPNTVWVDPAAAPGGDGTKTKPLNGIVAALAMVASGGRIALAAGSYDEPAYIQKPLEILGRCPSLTTIQGIAVVNGNPAVVAIETPGAVAMRGIRVTGAGVGIYVRDGSGTVTIDRVHVDHAASVGIGAAGGTVIVTRALVSDTQPDAKKAFGQGIFAVNATKLTVSSSALIANHDVGFNATGKGTEVHAANMCIAGTRANPTSLAFGVGLEAHQSATLTIESSAVVANRVTGILSADDGTTLTVRDCIVTGTLPQEADGKLGDGAEANFGARLDIDRTVILGNRNAGVLSNTANTHAKVTRSLIADTAPQQADGNVGAGAIAFGAGALELTGCAVVRNHLAAVLIASGGSAAVNASLLADTGPSQLDDTGSGALVIAPGALTLSDSALVHNRRVGVLALVQLQGLATVAMSKSLVADTTVGAQASYGVGIEIREGGSLSMASSAVVRNRRFAVAGHGEMIIDGSLVADTAPSSDGSYGVGIIATARAFLGGHLTLRDAVIAQSHTAGLLVGPDTFAEVQRVTVRGVAAGSFKAFAGDGSVSAVYDGIADGVVIAGGSLMHLDGARVTGASRAGVVSDASGGWLRSVRATGGQFGLVAQGTPKPDWSDGGNAFVGGTQAVLTDGALPVPGAPPVPK
jgi:hypothetical protein